MIHAILVVRCTCALGQSALALACQNVKWRELGQSRAELQTDLVKRIELRILGATAMNELNVDCEAGF